MSHGALLANNDLNSKFIYSPMPSGTENNNQQPEFRDSSGVSSDNKTILVNSLETHDFTHSGADKTPDADPHPDVLDDPAKGLLHYFDQLSHCLGDDSFNANELSTIKNLRANLVETLLAQDLEDTSINKIDTRNERNNKNNIKIKNKVKNNKGNKKRKKP